MAPTSPWVSPSIPSVKKRVSRLPVTAPGPEAEEPKAAWHVIAYINRDRALEHTG